METKPKIIADLREKNALVIAELRYLGIEVEMKHLKLADYLISNKIAVERKTINDFVNSMMNKRILFQMADMKKNYELPLIIIEKEAHQEIYKPSSHPNIHENAVRGMILSVAVRFGIPVIFSEDYKDTAEYLSLLARRELRPEKTFSFAVKRKAFSVKEQQQIIIESFPGIGPALAKNILNHFKTIKNFSNASIEELEKVPKLGRKKAMILKQILEFN